MGKVTYVAETGRTHHLLARGSLEMIDSTLMWYVIILDIGIFLTGLRKIAVGVKILRIFGRTSVDACCCMGGAFSDRGHMFHGLCR